MNTFNKLDELNRLLDFMEENIDLEHITAIENDIFT